MKRLISLIILIFLCGCAGTLQNNTDVCPSAHPATRLSKQLSEQKVSDEVIAMLGMGGGILTIGMLPAMGDDPINPEFVVLIASTGTAFLIAAGITHLIQNL